MNDTTSTKETHSRSSLEIDETKATKRGGEQVRPPLRDKGSPREVICSFRNLYEAMLKCKRNVGWKDSVASFANPFLISLCKLRQSLVSDTYEILPYTVFRIYEPKKRLITSTKFKDRVFQRSLTDNYLYGEMTKGFLENNFACQFGKGNDKAREYLDKMLRDFFKERHTDGYVLKCDIKDYFGSTPHSVAKAAVDKRVADDWAKAKTYQIIESFGDGKGIGLGSQVSQLVQLAVLDDLDHLIVENWGIKHYVRYMDDFIIIHHDRQRLLEIKSAIAGFLQGIGLSLNKKKSQIQPVKRPIRFLGYTFLLKRTGRVTWRLVSDTVRKERRKLRKIVRRCRLGQMPKRDVEDCYQSWRSHASKGDSRGRVHKMDRYYKSLWREKL